MMFSLTEIKILLLFFSWCRLPLKQEYISYLHEVMLPHVAKRLNLDVLTKIRGKLNTWFVKLSDTPVLSTKIKFLKYSFCYYLSILSDIFSKHPDEMCNRKKAPRGIVDSSEFPCLCMRER